MNENPDDTEPDSPEKKGRLNPGNGLGIGLAVGAVLYVVTDQAVWIPLGIAIGAGMGTAAQRRD